MFSRNSIRGTGITRRRWLLWRLSSSPRCYRVTRDAASSNINPYEKKANHLQVRSLPWALAKLIQTINTMRKSVSSLIKWAIYNCISGNAITRPESVPRSLNIMSADWSSTYYHHMIRSRIYSHKSRIIPDTTWNGAMNHSSISQVLCIGCRLSLVRMRTDIRAT